MPRIRAAFTLVPLFGISLLLGGMADAAMSITNRDNYERTLQIIEGADSETIHDVVIEPHETISGLCKEGCTVLLENGIRQSFEGVEEVQVHNGRFAWAP